MAKIMLNNVRISFPSLFRKATFNGEETKFEGTFLIGKKEGKATIDEIDAAIKGIMREDLKGTKLAPDKICFKDGDNIDYAGYAGNMSIKASSTKRPIVIDRDKSPLTEDDNRIYAGCCGRRTTTTASASTQASSASSSSRTTSRSRMAARDRFPTLRRSEKKPQTSCSLIIGAASLRPLSSHRGHPS